MKISDIKIFLKNHNNFLITAHTNPEGDCLGAELAFAKLIKKMGKNYEIVNADIYPKEYVFLPGVTNIKTRPKRKKFDAAIILDCSDISRIGNVTNYLNKEMSILNIDHHISNTYFGKINFVDVKASSACEVLYLLFEDLKIKLDKDMAICLYTGIVADTGSFRYTNTRVVTHLMASELLKYNINVAEIYRKIYEELSFSDLEFINKILLSLRKDKSGRIAWVKLTHDMFRIYKPQADITEHILNFLRSIKGVEVSILFKEIKYSDTYHVRLNLRSTGKFDVNEIAQRFGGGGHKTASGVTFKDINIKIAEYKVINFIKNKMKIK